jgi:E3 ubiquitin-protein ligase SHPRH
LKGWILLTRELVGFRNLFNERVKYYSHLNKISDGVVSPELDEDIAMMQQKNKTLTTELQTKITRELGKKRYFLYLSENNNQKLVECGSCLLDISTGVLTECGHWFCKDCTKTWIARHNKCPLCKARINPNDLPLVTLKKTSSSTQINENIIVLSVKSQKILGSFGTKIDMIIKHLQSILIKSPSAKVLIFSQWTTVLDIISTGLKMNQIGFVTLEGNHYSPKTQKQSKLNKAESIIEFNHNPFCSVFILNARSQSAGLTLNAATHVFLVEPLVSKGIELQSINRVHRIGQTNETFVWRYLVEGTVEENLVVEDEESLKVQSKDRGETMRKETLIRLFEGL